MFLIPELECEEVPRSLLQSCGSVPGWRSQRVHHEYSSRIAGATSSCLSSCSFPILCISSFYQQTAVSSGDTVTITFLKCLSKGSSKQQVFSYFLHLLVCFCSKENRSQLVDYYLHSWCACIYFTNLRNYFIQILLSHRNKTRTQNILLLVLAEQ